MKMPEPRPMRVGIVNDLSLAVEVLRRAIHACGNARVAWVAHDGADAVAKCAGDLPDLVLMDIVMPVMDGVGATRAIMQDTPCPILVVTSTIEGNMSRVYQCLGAGAFDAVETPRLGKTGQLEGVDALLRKLRVAASLKGGSGAGLASMPAADKGARPSAVAGQARPLGLIAIGASTGGPQALCELLKALVIPKDTAVVIVQHIDAGFAPGLASWLQESTGHQVRAIPDREELAPGIWLAATNDHLFLEKGALVYRVAPESQIYRPSVDVFFGSVAAFPWRRKACVLLTGMGRDGATGLVALKSSGWSAFAQSRASSVIWGMPGAAAELDPSITQLTPAEIGARLSASFADPMRG